MEPRMGNASQGQSRPDYATGNRIRADRSIQASARLRYAIRSVRRFDRQPGLRRLPSSIWGLRRPLSRAGGVAGHPHSALSPEGQRWRWASDRLCRNRSDIENYWRSNRDGSISAARLDTQAYDGQAVYVD